MYWAQYMGVEVCPFYSCCVTEHGFSSCADCPSLPCKMYKEINDPSLSQEQCEKEFKQKLENLKIMKGSECAK